MDILALAAGRIEAFHRKQEVTSWISSDENGIELGQRVLPLERIGIYAPGGLAAYPSTVFMAAIPAKIAGVAEIILVSPAKQWRIKSPYCRRSKISGVTVFLKSAAHRPLRLWLMEQNLFPELIKLSDPGTPMSHTAKKIVYGRVAIDMIAGPSEVLVIADGTARASFVAADLIAQAEHDNMASAILLTPDEKFARQVISEVEFTACATVTENLSPVVPWKSIAGLIITKDFEEAVTIANRFAPEHLE